MGGALAAFAAGLALLTSAPQAAPAAARSQVRPTISASGEHPCAISGGRAYCWGNNNDGELGDGTTVSASVPVAVNTSGALAGKTLIEVTTGDSLDTCALDTAGAAYCWGNGALGLLGDGSTISSTLPVAVQTSGVLAGKTLTQISAGYNETCALDSAGAAFCWGNNNDGELGDGSTTASSVPVAVSTSGVLAGKTLTQISAGFLQVCAVDTTGVAYCWGFNGSGQLGHPGLSDSDVPVAVDRGGVLAGKRLTQISAGFLQVCAVDSTGLGYCWGNDSYGQLGDGTIASSDVPVAVTSRGVLAGKALTQISTNFYQTCAVDSVGVAFCWGGNPDGELGNSTTKNSDVPVAVNASGVLAGQAMAQISSGDNNTCTLGRIGAAYCWGSNEHGQLGDGTAALGSNVPVAVTSFGSRPPQPPSHVTAKAGNTSAAVSWKGPASLGSGTLTGYMATATPRGRTCSTRKATTCTIRYLVNGTIYRITVITRTSTSHSVASAPATVTPRG
jgi:alpha-tubulin suppressor-like RCC1 family protein